jgi:hypothetical protein
LGICELIGEWGTCRLRIIRKLTAAWALVLVAACGGRMGEPYVLHEERSPDGRRVALVRLAPCGDGWCESLWIGPSVGQAAQVGTLARGVERCHEIAWRGDGSRVAFLIDGVQLRIYEAERGTPAGQVDLVAPGEGPDSRVARGVTFSDNGAAVTFDDCPRDRSGCRPGLVAIR